MNIFKTFTLKWWQGALFKWSIFALGILIGATWPGLFIAWRAVLLIVFIVPGIYVTWLWWKQ